MYTSKLHRNPVLLVLMLCFAPGPGLAAPDAQTLHLLDGYDSVLKLRRNSVVIETGARPELEAPECGLTIHVIDDKSDMKSDLSTSAKAGADYLSFSGEGSSTFVDSLHISTSDLVVAINAWKTTGVQVPGTTKYTGRTVPKAQLSQFVTQHGDGYISEVVEGAELIDLVVIHTRDTAEKEKVASDLHGNGIYDGVKFSAGVETALNTYITTSHREITRTRKMVGSLQGQQKVIGDTAALALLFCSGDSKETGARIASKGVVRYGFTGYEQLGVSHNPNFKVVRSNRRIFADLQADSENLDDLSKAISRIKHIYSTYGSFVDDQLNKIESLIPADRKIVRNQIAKYEDDPYERAVPVTLKSLADGTPTLNAPLQYTDLAGGDGGGSFDDVGDVHPVENAFRLGAITLVAHSENGCTQVGGIREQYVFSENTNGVVNVQNGPILQRGRRNTGSATLPLVKTAHIDKVEAWGDNTCAKSPFTVSRISLTTSGTSSAQSVSTGDSRGPVHSVVIPADHFLVGFYGRAGDDIDRIGIATVTFGKACWGKFPERPAATASVTLAVNISGHTPSAMRVPAAQPPAPILCTSD